jgi:hypothetical protein
MARSRSGTQIEPLLTIAYNTISNPPIVQGLVLHNANGSLFHPGTMYDLPKKMEVAKIYIYRGNPVISTDIFNFCG